MKTSDRSPYRKLLLLVTATALLLGCQLRYLLHTFTSPDLEAQLGDRLGLFVGAQLVALVGVAVLVWRLLLVLRYRPLAGVDDHELPELTVVVPAYNEGPQVSKTLTSLVASDYPRRKLHIVAVDDGSADDTWRHMHNSARQHPDRITAIRCRKNRGKRAALVEGFSRARGAVIVTVDSDSEVLPDTLRNLVAPFVRDPRVGAVAGNVRVLNTRGLLPPMLDVMFTYAFEFMRASESEVDTVMCCPGALAAYRRQVVDQVLPEWSQQTFLGQPATIGEDRAMTNLILRQGYLTRFQSNAVVLTEVPSTLPKLSRMFLRWARSNARETLMMARFAFTNFRPSPKLGARINLVLSAVRQVMALVTFVPSLVGAVLYPALLPAVALGLVAAALFRSAVFACSRETLRSLWAVPYAFLSAVCLSWITPYALITPHRSAWLTRTLPASAPASGSASASRKAARRGLGRALDEAA